MGWSEVTGEYLGTGNFSLYRMCSQFIFSLSSWSLGWNFEPLLTQPIRENYFFTVKQINDTLQCSLPSRAPETPEPSLMEECLFFFFFFFFFCVYGFIWFSLVNSVSTFEGYLMPNPSLLKNSKGTIQLIARKIRDSFRFPRVLV